MKTSRHLPHAGITGVLLALIVAIPAHAHADLVSSTPEDGAVLTIPPTTIELTFSEGLSASKSTFRVSGPDGAVGTGEAAKDGSEVMTLDGLALGPGGYTIKWTAVAEDGHVERGALTFTIAEAPSAPASPASPASPVPASPTAAPSSAPATASAAPASSAPASAAPVAQAGATASPADVPSAPASSGSDALIPIVAALVLVGGVGAFVLRRSRRA